MEDEKIVKRILAIECAVGNGSVAVLHGNFVDASSDEKIGSPARAEEVLPVINSVVSRAGISLHELDRIAVSVGPGSYSGIRIGAATATGLARALAIDCVGVSVLDAISSSAKMQGKFVAAVGVGRRHIGWSSYEVDHIRMKPLSKHMMHNDEEFGVALESLGTLTLLCDPTLSSRVRSVVPKNVVMTEIRVSVAELIGKFVHDHPQAASARPIYLRDQARLSGQPAT